MLTRLFISRLQFFYSLYFNSLGCGRNQLYIIRGQGTWLVSN